MKTTKPKKQGHVVPSQAKVDRALQAAAFDLMCRGRPLKPPPYDFQRVTVRASELALRADKKAGLW